MLKVKYPSTHGLDGNIHTIDIENVHKLSHDNTYIVHGKESGSDVILHLKETSPGIFVNIPHSNAEYTNLNRLKGEDVTEEMKRKLDGTELGYEEEKIERETPKEEKKADSSEEDSTPTAPEEEKEEKEKTETPEVKKEGDAATAPTSEPAEEEKKEEEEKEEEKTTEAEEEKKTEVVKKINNKPRITKEEQEALEKDLNQVMKQVNDLGDIRKKLLENVDKLAALENLPKEFKDRLTECRSKITVSFTWPKDKSVEDFSYVSEVYHTHLPVAFQCAKKETDFCTANKTKNETITIGEMHRIKSELVECNWVISTVTNESKKISDIVKSANLYMDFYQKITKESGNVPDFFKAEYDNTMTAILNALKENKPIDSYIALALEKYEETAKSSGLVKDTPEEVKEAEPAHDEELHTMVEESEDSELLEKESRLVK